MKRLPIIFGAGLLIGFFLIEGHALAQEWKTTITPEMRYASVDGRTKKFEAQHWMNGGFDAGVSEYRSENDNLNGVEVSTEGHAMPGNADYAAEVKLRHSDEWHFGLGFNQFRKYYDSLGGVHPIGDALRVTDSNRDLFVDIGKFEIETGRSFDNFPDVDLAYEYEYKTGTKSRLTWATVTDSGVARKTSPSWQEIDEEVHVFEVKLHDNWKGFQWMGEQKWEHFTNDTKREEKQLSVNTTASERMIRNHFLTPKADSFSSIWDIKKWFFKDKVLATTGYRYAQIENSEVESVVESNESYQVFNFTTTSHQVLPSDSTNQYRSHTGVASVFWQLTRDWTLGLKGKLEDIRKNGQSTLNNDTVAAASAPDRIADRYDVSNSTSDLKRVGEGVSLRFTGIPNLAFYNDVEFEQVNNDLHEDRQSRSAGEVFTRMTVNRSYRGTEEVGFNYRPVERFLWAGQYRYRHDNVDYDDELESTASTTARSAFFDGQKGIVHQVSTRATLKIYDWLKPTARYQFQNYAWISRFEGADLDLESNTISHTTTVDLPFQVTQELSLTASYQIVDMETVTPANEDTPQNYAPFHGDTHTWMLSTNYAVSSVLALVSNFQYQTAGNVMDINSTGVPYGADYDKIDLSFGVKYKLSKNMTFEPRYDFYRYDPNSNVDAGKYNAHVMWLGLSIDWA